MKNSKGQRMSDLTSELVLTEWFGQVMSQEAKLQREGRTSMLTYSNDSLRHDMTPKK